MSTGSSRLSIYLVARWLRMKVIGLLVYQAARHIIDAGTSGLEVVFELDADS